MSDSGNGPPPGDELLDVEARYLATGDIAEGHATDLQELVGARTALGAVATWHELDDDLETLISAQIQRERSSGSSPARRRSRISVRALAAAAVVTAIVAFGAGWLVNAQQDSDTSEIASAATAVPTAEIPTATVPTAVPTEAPTPSPTEIPTVAPTVQPTTVPTPPPDAAVALASGEFAPEASASAELRETVSGVQVDLRVDGLPPAPDNGYYQGRFLTNDDVLVTIGTFHLRGDDEPVILWSGLDLQDVKMLMVTVQQIDGGPASSGVVALRGPVHEP